MKGTYDISLLETKEDFLKCEEKCGKEFDSKENIGDFHHVDVASCRMTFPQKDNPKFSEVIFPQKGSPKFGGVIP